MVLLIDLDSILYKGVYKIITEEQLQEAEEIYEPDKLQEWKNYTALTESVNRIENELLLIQEYLQAVSDFEFTEIRLYITCCHNSFRKEMYPLYKANRKEKPEYLDLVYDYYKLQDTIYDDRLEADDLIAMDVEKLGRENCIVVSMDKDLKTIGGWYWSYYKSEVKDFEGNVMYNDFGSKEREYKQKEIKWITQEEANKLFWIQMLMGDKDDNIPSLRKLSKKERDTISKEKRFVHIDCTVGIKTAEKILKDSENYFKTVYRQYRIRGQKEDFWLMYKLLKIG